MNTICKRIWDPSYFFVFMVLLMLVGPLAQLSWDVTQALKGEPTGELSVRAGIMLWLVMGFGLMALYRSGSRIDGETHAAPWNEWTVLAPKQLDTSGVVRVVVRFAHPDFGFMALLRRGRIHNVQFALAVYVLGEDRRWRVSQVRKRWPGKASDPVAYEVILENAAAIAVGVLFESPRPDAASIVQPMSVYVGLWKPLLPTFSRCFKTPLSPA